MSLTTLTKSEEKLKWRQDDLVNNGEASSPILSHRGDFQATTQKRTSNRNYYYTLAKESPARVYEDSDTSTYDNSFHCRETDVCRDSTDSDSDSSSFTADAIATVELLEYEVASTSNNEELFSNDSSSGTDEHDFIIATVAASRICETTSCASDFADSEESDSSKSYDSELTAADYWKCIRCKNTQNNPMFRMCEKCYKTRRTHFPPRPRFRKKRSNRNRKATELISARNYTLSSSSSEPNLNYTSNALSQEDEVTKRLGNGIPKDGLKSTNTSPKDYNNGYKKRKLSFTNNNTSQLNSAAETSGEEWRDVDIKNNSSIGNRKRKSPLRKRDNFSTNQSSSGHCSLSTNIFSNNLDTSLSRKRKASSSEVNIQHLKQSRINTTNNLKRTTNNIHTDSESDAPSISAPESQKDSGISSTNSSQEPVSSSLSDERSIEKDEYLEQCSQETVCGDIDERDLLELQEESKLKSEQPAAAAATIKCHISEIVTNTNSISTDDNNTALIRSVSDISNTLLTDAQAKTLNETLNLNLHGNKDRNGIDANFTDYSGSCVICLSEPKNGVFVHSTILHLCSCYKCAVKIWHKYKRCPICNSSVKNVMKLFVH